VKAVRLGRESSTVNAELLDMDFGIAYNVEMAKATLRKSRPARKDGYVVAGVTRDGVSILKSSGRATHFTDKQIDAAIVRVRAASVLADSGSKPK
jgi:hypothetical protein